MLVTEADAMTRESEEKKSETEQLKKTIANRKKILTEEDLWLMKRTISRFG